MKESLRRPTSLAAIAAAGATLLLPHTALHAGLWDLNTDWSDANNPNGVWSYNEGTNPLPHVDWWQRNLGGWTTAQPAWARSEDGPNRIAMWYRSNGTEQFEHDWLTDDILIHTTDEANGIGNGPGNVTWTSPVSGTISLAGGVWMGRDIGRANDWSISKNGTLLTRGSLSSGDSYSRTNPFQFSLGSGGSAAVTGISVAVGDVIKLEIIKTSQPGDFTGVNLTIFDDVLHPAAPGQLRIEQAGANAVKLLWSTKPAAFYVLEASDEVVPVNWTPILGPTPGDGSEVQSLEPTDSHPRRFFRLLTTE